MSPRAQALGRYALLRQVGSGGMAEVWKAKAQGPAGFEKVVAVKKIHPHLGTDPEFVDMFIGEAKLVAQMEHPNIVRVYDFGHAGEPPDYFIAMEYVAGSDLDTLLDRLRRDEESLPFEVAIHIAVAVARGLGHAHDGPLGQAIVHRDMSPHNVLLSYSGAVKITDFGIAKVVTQLSRTAAGVMKGKAAYVSPEQTRLERLDHRSDLFSLGAVLIELLTSRRLIAGRDMEDRIDLVRHFDPDKSEDVQQLPERVRRILVKLLQNDPRDRYQSARELEHDLIALIGHEKLAEAAQQLGHIMEARFADELEMEQSAAESSQPIEVALTRTMTPSLSRAERLHAPTVAHRVETPGKRRLATVAWAAAVTVLIAAMGLTWYFQDEDGPPPVALVADFENQTDDEKLDAVGSLVASSLRTDGNVDVVERARMNDLLRSTGRGSVVGHGVRGTVSRELARLASATVLIEGTVATDGSTYTVGVELVDPGKPGSGRHVFARLERSGDDVMAVVENVSRAVTRRLRQGSERTSGDGTIAPTQNLEAYHRYFEGDRLFSDNKSEYAEKKYREAIELDPQFALAWYKLAYVLSWRGRPSAEPLNRAFELLQENPSAVPEKEQFMMRALRAGLSGNYPEQHGILQAFVDRYPDDKDAVFRLGDREFHHGDVTSAIENFKRTLELDPTFEPAHGHLLWAYTHVRDAEGTRAHVPTYLSRLRTAQAFDYSAAAYVAHGEHDLAREVVRQGFDVHPEHAPLFGQMAAMAVFEKRYEEAWAWVEKWEAHGVTDHGTHFRPFIYSYLGRYDEAERAYRTRIENAANVYGLDSQARHRGQFAFFLAVGPEQLGRARQQIESAPGWPDLDRFVRFHALLIAFDDGDEQLARELVSGSWAPDRLEALVDARFGCAVGEHPKSLRGIEHAAPRGAFRFRPVWNSMLARCRAQAGDTDGAVAALDTLQEQRIFDLFYMTLYPRSLHLEGRILEDAGRDREALAAYETLLRLWEGADEDAPLLVDTRARAAALRGR